jgi:anti-sigma B factor antagonist
MVDETPTDHGQSPDPGASTFAASWVGRVAVISAVGTVDVLTSPQLTEAFDAVLAEQPSAVIIDLTEVDFLASAGMSALIDANEKASGSAQFGVVAIGPTTSRPMRLVGLHEVISLYETLDDAIGGVSDE